MPRSRPIALVALAAIALVPIIGCGDDDTSDTTTGATATSTESGPTQTSVSDAARDDLEVWQTDLNAVGCYAGALDGALGRQTEAAVRAFQEAGGLSVDGLLGPETESALQDALSEGEIVCASPPATTTEATTSTTSSTGPGTASLSSVSYSKAFPLDACSLNADVSNTSLRGKADGLSLSVDASEGLGKLSIAGGDEQDAITLKGDITAVDITPDRSFAVTGDFEPPSLTGEMFTLSGGCPE